MAPRSNWKGYLKLSLVSASIAIYPATSFSEKVRFNTLNRATGNRLKRKMVDAVTEEEVPTEEQVKGYAIGKDQYVTVEDDELSEIAIESSHTVDIEKFVPKSSIEIFGTNFSMSTVWLLSIAISESSSSSTVTYWSLPMA